MDNWYLKIILENYFLISFNIILLIFSYYFLKQHKFYSFLFNLIIIFFVNLFYSSPILNSYFSNIGFDVIFQLYDFNINDAKFIIKSFLSDLMLDIETFSNARFKTIIIFSLFSSLVLIFILKFFNLLDLIKSNLYLRSLNLICILIFTFFGLKNLEYIYTNAFHEFSHRANSIIKNEESITLDTQAIDRKLKVITFVSESIASMNMSLYGYPFSTTPNLKDLSNSKNFILFNSMYSVHTLSSHTLFAVFNLCIICSNNKSEKFVKVAPIINLLKKAKIKTAVISNQPGDGYSNLIEEEILFKDTEYFLRNKFDLKEKEFFNKKFCGNEDLKDYRNIILHSYVGHYDYNAQVPARYHKFVYPKDINKENFLASPKGTGFLGSPKRTPIEIINYKKILSSYDSTLLYLDKIVDSVIKCSKNKSDVNDQPVIFIYFSDHGEAPMANAGHDSSKLIIEMLQIPFFIYFNDVAISMYPELFNYIKNLSNKRLTQSIYSNLILKIFKINLSYEDKIQKIDHNVEDSIKNISYVKHLVNRKLLNNKQLKTNTYWNKNFDLDSFTKNDFWYQDTDHIKNKEWNKFFSSSNSISNWQLSNIFNNKKNDFNKKIYEPIICQHRSNTLARQIRGIFSIGCVEIDVNFYDDAAFGQYNRDLEPINLKYIFNSEYKHKFFWLDGKNLNNLSSCLTAYKWINNNLNFNLLLLEIPSSAYNLINDDEYADCIKSIDSLPKVEVAYYTPTEDGMCDPFAPNSCDKYYEKINKVIKAFSINSITFDFERNYGAISNNLDFKDLRLHIWNISNPMQILSVSKKFNLGLVIPKNNEHALNLN